MACYIVACELTRPGEDYIELTEAIERLATESRLCLKALWLVVTDKSAAQIRDELRPYLGQNDQLLVAQLSGEAAWRAPDGRFSSDLATLLPPREAH